MVIRPVLALLAAVLAPLAAAGPAAFTEAEVRAILAHGPWPAPATRDATNRVSGRKEAIQFGEQLFFERRLSGSGRFACGSCHVPERNWTDNLKTAEATAPVERNTPTLVNVRLGRWFGWDGAADSLWSQSLRPILDPRELASSPAQVARLVRHDEQLACRYRHAFGAPPSPTDDQAVLVDVAKALAAFQETLESPPTPFDRFRDALAKGLPITPLVYSEAAQRGARLFVGKAGCNACHSGPNFSSGEFHDNGFAALARTKAPQGGRAQALERLKSSPYNLAGRHNDDPGGPGGRELAQARGDKGAFKVPTLRHLFLSPPYGHHGEVGTLAEAVRHYSERGSATLKPVRLTRAEQSDLVVFLESLSTFSNPWRPDDFGHCE